MVWVSPGLEWTFNFGPEVLTDENLGLIRNLAASSRALQVQRIYVRTSNAALVNVNRVGAATGLGTSAGVTTPVFGIVGGTSGAAWTDFGKAYYGTAAANTGISASGATSVTWAQIDAGKGDVVADEVVVNPGQALVIRADPDAAGYVQATCRVRVIPLGEYQP